MPSMFNLKQISVATISILLEDSGKSSFYPAEILRKLTQQILMIIPMIVSYKDLPSV